MYGDIKTMKIKAKKLPEALAERLPVYYRHIKIISAEGRKRITSSVLAEKAGNTATQVRQDFFTCGGTGSYLTADLEKWFEKTLGTDKKTRVIVIGAGNLGRAIISCREFEKDGFFIDAAFDSDLSYEGIRVADVPIYNINLLESYLSENPADIAVIAAPAEAAEKIHGKLIKNKIRGIWNFSPCDLKSTENCVVRNTMLTDSLLTLSFRMKEKFKE